MTSKICRQCGESKLLRLYYQHPGMSDGRLNICISCKLIYAARQRKAISRKCIICGGVATNSKFRADNGAKWICSRACVSKHLILVGHKPPKKDGPNTWNWKGDSAKYGTLHDWVYYHRGSPRYCEHCGTTKKRMYHWANKSGEYKRDLDDWIRLCVPCHRKYDKR